MLFPLERVMAYDVNAEAARTYAKEMKERFGLEVTVVNTPQEAVSGLRHRRHRRADPQEAASHHTGRLAG